ncbi:MAG: carbon-nitrogen family hydrolase [Anaerovibrio sp.]|uniref:carbon-nitrogen family hydrolase n=1 Tax=Anaerovibrio sp. TaxID=1872532 RepID=UPI0025D1A26B|nr:carbon-nitrogen family hydrolase [Anaerovibrio sp.]MCR5177339.1 carbon-nitrogen family hydrolase [Anaerovibrio sp.]
MKVSAVQLPIITGNKIYNTNSMEHMLNDIATLRTDVVVLPELWNTGFYPKPISHFADLDGEHTIKSISQLAAKYMLNIIAGSVPTNRGGKIYNTSYIFNRSGNLIATYDKVHLFSPSGEDRDFTPGDRMVTFTLDGIKCGIATCYDIRFPEYIRSLALADISVLFVPAAWPSERLMHWDTLLRARAIENQIFVVGVNGISDPDGEDFHLGGHSTIIDPWGEILAQGSCSKLEGEVIHANLRIAIQDKIKESIDVFNDRRPEVY